MNKIKQGLCPKCESVLDLNHLRKEWVCVSDTCSYIISDVDYYFEMTLEESKEEEYHVPDVDENLYYLNNL